jgi:hypothetical protein
MRTYCSAYRLAELRAFAEWADAGAAADLGDEDIVYLWDDLTVVRSPVSEDEHPIHASVTPAWREFCQTRLGFSIPADLRYRQEADADDAG